MGAEEIVERAEVSAIGSDLTAIPVPETFRDQFEACVGRLSPGSYRFPVAKGYDGAYRVQRKSVCDWVVRKADRRMV